MYKHFFKRVLDFSIALIALICISPILLVVTVWLHFANKGAGAASPPTPSPKGEETASGGNKGWLRRFLKPVIFTQERPGKDAKIFKVIKFKTMTDERDTEGKLLPDAQRLTKVGRFVRSTSIDELPQLINVLKGDMALIGPRPLTPIYLRLFNKEQARRMEVRPGISGWAQVHGRNHCKLSKKFELDVWYVDHCTLATDLKVIWLTIISVIKRSDVGEGNADMKEVDDLGFLKKIKELKEQKKDAQ